MRRATPAGAWAERLRRHDVGDGDARLAAPGVDDDVANVDGADGADDVRQGRIRVERACGGGDLVSRQPPTDHDPCALSQGGSKGGLVFGRVAHIGILGGTHPNIAP